MSFYSNRLVFVTILAVSVLVFPTAQANESTILPPAKISTPDAMQWVDGPAGTKMALLEGDPAKSGPFTMRVKLPAGHKVAPHIHPGIEHATVLSGALNIGIGENVNTAKSKALPVGSFVVMQPGTVHFGWVSEETVLQLHGMGPWGIVFVNPKDAKKNSSAHEKKIGDAA